LAKGIPFVLVTTTAVVATSILANALMQRWPRRHALWFVLGVLTVIALGIGALSYRQQMWGEGLGAAAIAVWVVLAVMTVLVTSGFGSWRSEMEAMRATFRADVDAEFLTARVRSQHLADIARDAARVLHGSVQSRLVACAMAIDRASASGDRDALVAALAAAREALEEPLPERTAIAGSIADEVSRKVALWGDACTFTIDVDPGASTSDVDPLTVGRVVEEGLTNAIRHGAATAISVSVGADGGGVVVVVADDGTGPKEGTAGLGSALLDQATGGAWSLDRMEDLTVLRAHIPASRLPTGTSLNV
jgi:signal transduction histidine kinase